MSIHKPVRPVVTGALILGTAVGCSTHAPVPPEREVELEVVEELSWRVPFRKAETSGVFALHRIGSRRVSVSDVARAGRPYLPASTFKIPNSLIALELGIVEDDQTWFPMTWDTTSIRAWNSGHTFASALQNSVVPIYQIIARRVGGAAYTDWLDRLGYGNRDPGGGIDHFWLDGALRTSALDQISFLTRLARGELPISERTGAIVRRMMVEETTECHRLYGKTGLVGVAAQVPVPPEERVGWYVGWVESGSNVWVFALNLDVKQSEHARGRVSIARKLLANTGALPIDGCGRSSQSQEPVTAFSGKPGRALVQRDERLGR